MLLALLQSGQHEVNCGSFDLVRPLHEASLQGHFECVRILLDFGAQVRVSLDFSAQVRVGLDFGAQVRVGRAL